MIPEDILSFFDVNQGRRPKVLINLMVGKETVSSLFWGLNYEMLSYIDLWKQIDQTQFLKMVKEANKLGLLITQDDKVFLTNAGQQKQISLGSLSSNALELKLDEALDLFLLSSQVISELSFKNSLYVPINDDNRINFLVKRWFKSLKGDFVENRKMVLAYKDALKNVLSELSDEDADLFINYLPNHADSGMTIAQLARNLNLTQFQTELKLRIIFKKVFDVILSKEIYPLFDLIRPLLRESILPDSVLQSWKLLQKGMSIQQVAKVKNIKENTVKEHILTVAILKDQFPYEKFTIMSFELPGRPETWKFEDAQKLDSRLTFFDFRLIQIKKIKDLQNDRSFR